MSQHNNPLVLQIKAQRDAAFVTFGGAAIAIAIALLAIAVTMGMTGGEVTNGTMCVLVGGVLMISLGGLSAVWYGGRKLNEHVEQATKGGSPDGSRSIGDETVAPRADATLRVDGVAAELKAIYQRVDEIYYQSKCDGNIMMQQRVAPLRDAALTAWMDTPPPAVD